MIINERGGNNTSFECGVGQYFHEEGDIGIETADAAFLKDSFYARKGFGKTAAAHSVFDKHGIVIGSDIKSWISYSVHTKYAQQYEHKYGKK